MAAVKRISLRILAILMLLMLASPALAQETQTPCSNWTFGEAVGTQPITEIVPAIPGARVYVCGYVMNAVGSQSVNFQLFTGTTVTTHCDTNQAAMTPNFTINPNGDMVNHLPVSFMWTPQGQALCANATQKSGGTLQWIIYWEQH